MLVEPYVPAWSLAGAYDTASLGGALGSETVLTLVGGAVASAIRNRTIL